MAYRRLQECLDTPDPALRQLVNTVDALCVEHTAGLLSEKKFRALVQALIERAGC